MRSVVTRDGAKDQVFSRHEANPSYGMNPGKTEECWIDIMVRYHIVNYHTILNLLFQSRMEKQSDENQSGLRS